jgi:acetylornithine deacetylase/succinyl-diaminopimelate desuccinylase-like protein
MGSGPIIYGECAGPKSFVVYDTTTCSRWGHLTEWSFDHLRPPFKRSFTRAGANSKGDLIARLAAVEAYQKSFGKLPVTLRFIVEGEDGLGSPSLYRFTSEHADLLKADGCLWDEGYRDTTEAPVVSLGFKGITFLELRVFGARSDLHSKWGAIVPNPAWRLVQALATITSPKGVITIDGFSSHIAPISDEDIEVLKAIQLDEVGLKREFRISGWVRSMKGQSLVKEHIFGPTCTICGIQTGHTDAGAKTVLPGTAMARLDFRLVPDLTAEIVVGLLRKHLDVRGFKDIEIIELGSAPLAKSSSKSGVARAVIESTAEVYGKPALIYPMDPAVDQSGRCAALAAADTSRIFGTSYAAPTHGPDENIRIEDFLQSISSSGE